MSFSPLGGRIALREHIKGRRVLVTGGSGFIGTHLCKLMIEKGASVEAWIRPRTKSPNSLPRLLRREVNLREVDIRDEAAVKKALMDRPPDLIFHLAGVRSTGNDPASLAQMTLTNVLGTLNVIDNVEPDTPIIESGSCEEYGRGPVPFSETQSPQPESFYSLTKMLATRACQSLANSSSCVARLAVVYGPGQSGEMFIPSLIRACLDGQTFHMTLGEQTRDFVYVEDAVAALIALAECREARGQVVNVGTGVEHTLKDVAQQSLELSGAKIRLQMGTLSPRSGEANRYVCSVEKIRRLTGWQPKVDIREGLAGTINWWRQGSPQPKT